MLKQMIVEDAKCAQLSSAEGEDALDDPHCQAAAKAVDDAAICLRDLVSAHVLTAKRTLARESQASVANLQRQHASEVAALSASLAAAE